jgi:hypothetical protein
MANPNNSPSPYDSQDAQNIVQAILSVVNGTIPQGGAFEEGANVAFDSEDAQNIVDAILKLRPVGAGQIAAGSLDLNSILDQQIDFTGGLNFIPQQIILIDASGNVTTAKDGQFWTGINRTGTHLADIKSGLGPLPPAFDNLQFLTAPSDYIDITNNQSIGLIDFFTTYPPAAYFSLGTAQGAPMTVKYFIFGYAFPF